MAHDCIGPLLRAGFTHDDALALRRIAMTLHRWHEMECGINEGCVERDEPWAIKFAGFAAPTRWWTGDKWADRSRRRTYADAEKAKIMEGLPTARPWTQEDFVKAQAAGFPAPGAWKPTGSKPYWRRSSGEHGGYIPDREAGAKKRLAAIMERYPRFSAYIQGDPRGAALYILRPGDVPQGEAVDAYYSRGLAVYK